MQTVFLDFSCSETLELPPSSVSKMRLAGFADRTKQRRRIPAITDLSAFIGESVLCIVDCDNWDIALKAHALKVRYDWLLTRLRDRARHVCPVAVITSNPDDHRREDALEHCGWRVISIPRETIITCKGLRKVANADADLCYELGVLASVTEFTTALLGTGDGDLAVTCSKGLRRTCGDRPIAVHTLSVVGASSSRLWQRTDLFDSSLIIGQDMLTKVNARHELICRFTQKGEFSCNPIS